MMSMLMIIIMLMIMLVSSGSTRARSAMLSYNVSEKTPFHIVFQNCAHVSLNAVEVPIILEKIWIGDEIVNVLSSNLRTRTMWRS